MKDWIKKNTNMFNLIVTICYYFYIQITILVDVGEYTKGQNLITLWDAIWVPFVIVVIPVFMGFSIRKDQGE